MWKPVMKLKNALKTTLLVAALLLVSLSIHSTSNSEATSGREATPSTPKEVLKELIAKAETRPLADYTPISWTRMMSMLVTSKSIYNNQTATVEQINRAIDLLTTRLNELAKR